MSRLLDEVEEALEDRLLSMYWVVDTPKQIRDSERIIKRMDLEVMEGIEYEGPEVWVTFGQLRKLLDALFKADLVDAPADALLMNPEFQKEIPITNEGDLDTFMENFGGAKDWNPRG